MDNVPENKPKISKKKKHSQRPELLDFSHRKLIKYLNIFQVMELKEYQINIAQE